MTRKVEEALDHVRLQELFAERALVHDAMDTTRIQKIREEMERYEARRLQPDFIASFFTRLSKS